MLKSAPGKRKRQRSGNPLSRSRLRIPAYSQGAIRADRLQDRRRGALGPPAAERGDIREDDLLKPFVAFHLPPPPVSASFQFQIATLLPTLRRALYTASPVFEADEVVRHLRVGRATRCHQRAPASGRVQSSGCEYQLDVERRGSCCSQHRFARLRPPWPGQFQDRQDNRHGPPPPLQHA